MGLNTNMIKKAEEVARGQHVKEMHEAAKVGDLMWRASWVYWRSGRRIPQYFDYLDYNKHNFNDWVDHFKADLESSDLKEAGERNLAKYGLNLISTPFIYKVDDQYVRLRDKSSGVVRRYFDFNKVKRDVSFCSRFLGETKADANYHACRRVLVERGILG